MKAIIFILLTGFIYASEVQKSDSLVSINNKSVKTNIVSIDENFVKIESDKIQSDILLKSIDKIFVDTLDEVYNKEIGFTIKLTELQKFLNYRYRNILKEKEKNRVSINNKNTISNLNNVKTNDLLEMENPGNKKWSFSVIYSLGHKQVESYDFIISTLRPIPFMSFLTETSNGELETEITYKVFNNFHVTAFLGYSAASFNQMIRTERDTLKYGTEQQNTLNRFLFEVGLKYYIGNPISNNVSAFIIGTIGKQYAFSSSYFNRSYPYPTNDFIFDDNADSFIEKLNSPWLFTLGFGAEYYFNKSLSIFGLLRYSYSVVSSEYHSKLTFPNSSYIEFNNKTVRNAKINYRTGLGINFYF